MLLGCGFIKDISDAQMQERLGLGVEINKIKLTQISAANSSK